MSITPDTSGWHLAGCTANSRYFAVEPGILACVPNPKSMDTSESARENAQFQELYWVQRGESGTCIVFFDSLIDQDAEARRVYATYPFENQRATALVGGTALSRAIASFFTGLSLPATRTKFFASLPEAMEWCREIVRADRGAA